LWFPAEPGARIWLVLGLLAALSLASPARCQRQDDSAPVPPPAPQAPRRLPGGIRINSASLYGEGDWLNSVPAGGTPSTTDLWVPASGATAGLAWRLNNRETEFETLYLGTYSRNEVASSLNGFGHELNISLRTEVSRTTTLSIAGSGQSGMMSNSLFEPSVLLNQVQRSSPTSQLIDNLTGAAGGVDPNSPLSLMLAGLHRRSAILNLTLTHSHSRRLTSYAHLQGARELRSFVNSESNIRAPNMTLGSADAGISYSYTPRTRIVGAVSYARTYTELYRSDWKSASIGVDQLIGRHSFATVQGGYAQVSDPVFQGSAMNSYAVTGSAGTTSGDHTLALMVRRGASDQYGLGPGVTTGASGAWSWAPHSSKWTVSASFGREQQDAGAMGLTRAWMAQATAVRILLPTVRIVYTAVYLTGSGGVLVNGSTRTGFRLTLLWLPDAIRAR
jgi:hypothetical protein